MVEVTLDAVRSAMPLEIKREIRNMPDEEFLRSKMSYDLGLDSLDIVELIVELQHQLHISISEDMFDMASDGKMSIAEFIEQCNQNFD